MGGIIANDARQVSCDQCHRHSHNSTVRSEKMHQLLAETTAWINRVKYICRKPRQGN